jgi:hypothetical protein
MSEKQRLKFWDQDKTVRARGDVRIKQMRLKKAQKLFNVPKTSFRPYVNMKGKPPEEAVLTKLGRRPVFSRDMEQELIEYLLMTKEKYFGLTRQDVRMVAFPLVKNNNLKKSLSELRGCAGTTG